MLEVGLRIPRGFDWLASSDPSTEGRVRDAFQPWTKDLMEVRTHFGAVHGAVNGEHAMLKRQRSFAFFWDARRKQRLV